MEDPNRVESKRMESIHMKAIAVYCGSGEGVSPAYREAAVRLGRELAKRHITLVYGGARVGLRDS